MNTTRTAQYAAQAAKSSCLFALVKIDIAMPKTSVKMINIPIASNADARFPISDNSYIATTGNTSSVVFGANPSGTSFDTTFQFLNDVAGTYNINLGTSTQNLLFTLVTVSAAGGATTGLDVVVTPRESPPRPAS